MAVLHLPMGQLLPNYYVNTTTVTFAALGAAALIARLFDAFSDPLIGYLSDRTKTRFGARKPWVMGGALLAIPATWFMFNPTAESGLLYYGFWYIVVTLSWTMVEIPHQAWGADLAENYNDRSRISFFRQFFSSAGAVMFYSLPLLPIFASKEFDGDVFRFASLALIAGIIILVPLTLAFAPEPQRKAKTPPLSFSTFSDLVTKIKPFRIFAVVITIFFLAAGMYSAPFVIFIDTELQLSDRIAQIFTTIQFTSIACMIIWPFVLKKFNKHRVWAFSHFIVAFALCAIAFVPRGEAGFWPLMMLMILNGSVGYASLIAAPAVLMDIADYDVMKNGVARAGVLFAIYVLLYKLTIGIGYSISFNILAFSGYEANQENTTQARAGLYLTMFVIPFILYITAAAMIWFFPLDKRRVQTIQNRLASR